MNKEITTMQKWGNWALINGLHLFYAALIFTVGLWIAKRASRAVSQMMRVRKVEETVVKFVSKLFYYALMLFVMIAVLSKLNVPMTSLIAILGGMSLAIGLSLRLSLIHI